MDEQYAQYAIQQCIIRWGPDISAALHSGNMLATRSLVSPAPARAAYSQQARPRRLRHAVVKAEFDVDNASVLVAGGCQMPAPRVVFCKLLLLSLADFR